MPGHVTASWSSVADCSGPTRATWPERACECGEGRAGPGRPAGSTPHTGSWNARRGGRRTRACGGERLVLGRIRAARVFSLLALCLLFSGAGGESGSQDGIRGGAGPDNDTSYPSGREGLRSYPASIHSGRMRRQTVDDLVYNHFLIHSAGGSGRWGGGVAGRGEGDGAPNPWTLKGENAGCDDTIASLSAELFDESNISSTTPQTSASKPAVGCRLWRSRYLMAVESFVSDDGQTAIRLARDYQADGSTKDALRLIKFMRCEHEFGRHWARLQHVYRAFPHLVAQPVEAFEASPDEVDGSLGTFVIVMQGGQPLSHVIAQQDKGDGIERALAVRILQDVEAAVVSLSAAGYAPDELSVRHIMLRSGRAIFLDPPVSVSPHHVDASGGNSPHLSSASQSHALAALESPLCLPEQVHFPWPLQSHLHSPCLVAVIFSCVNASESNHAFLLHFNASICSHLQWESTPRTCGPSRIWFTSWCRGQATASLPASESKMTAYIERP